MDPLTSELKQNFENIINSLKQELKSIRTGRATPALLENLTVEAYGGQSKMSLSSLASISTSGPTVLQVRPFDPSIIQDLEKAILKSSLNLTPRVQGQEILVNIPPLSEEQREKFIKLVGQIIEEKKNAMRGSRDDIRKKIKSQYEKKDITEDLKFRLEKEIDNLAQKYTEEILDIKSKKETEIREI